MRGRLPFGTIISIFIGLAGVGAPLTFLGPESQWLWYALTTGGLAGTVFFIVWGAVDRYNDHREAQKRPRLKLEPSHLIWVGMIGALCSVLTLAVGVIWQTRQQVSAKPTQPLTGAFTAEVPKGPGARECFSDGLKELRGMLAVMRQVTAPNQSHSPEQLSAFLEASREVHDKLTGPGEGPFFSRRPECKSYLQRLFPNNTQATWNDFNSGLYHYLNALKLGGSEGAADKTRDLIQTKILNPSSNALRATIEEITARLKAADDAMQ